MYWFLINHSNKLKQKQHKVRRLQVRSIYSFRVGLRVAWWRKLKVSHPAQKPHLFRLIIGGSSYFGVGARGRRKLNDSRNNRTGKCPSESKGVTSFFDKIWHKSVCGGCGCGGGQVSGRLLPLRMYYGRQVPHTSTPVMNRFVWVAGRPIRSHLRLLRCPVHRPANLGSVSTQYCPSATHRTRQVDIFNFIEGENPTVKEIWLWKSIS